MKLKYTFDLMEIDDSWMAIPISESDDTLKGIIKLNETAYEIFKLLNEETSERKIVESMTGQYDISNNELSKYVHRFVEELRQQDLLE